MSKFTDDYLREELEKVFLNTLNKEIPEMNHKALAKIFSRAAFDYYRNLSPYHDCAYFLRKAGTSYQCGVCKSFYDLNELLMKGDK